MAAVHSHLMDSSDTENLGIQELPVPLDSFISPDAPSQDGEVDANQPTGFFGLARELRDKVYSEYLSDRPSGAVVPENTRKCTSYSCLHGPLCQDRPIFPILFTCRQILKEFQDMLIRQGMYLHFEYIFQMKRFFDSKYQVHLKANLTSVSFNWRGGGETCVTAAHAIILLQTLTSLKHLTVIIGTNVPMRARHNYISNKLKSEGGQDIVFRVMDAIGFDELCSIRGLSGHVKVRLQGYWRNWNVPESQLSFPFMNREEVNEMRRENYVSQQQAALSRYFSMLLTRKKPLDYGAGKKLRVPYYAWSDDHDVSWIGWDKENQEKQLEDERLIGW